MIIDISQFDQASGLASGIADVANNVPIIPSCVSNYSSSSLVFHKSIFLYQMSVLKVNSVSVVHITCTLHFKTTFQTISSFNIPPIPSNSIFINWILKIQNLNICAEILSRYWLYMDDLRLRFDQRWYTHIFGWKCLINS